MKNELNLKQDLNTDRDHGLHLLYQMIRIRRFEEKSAEMYTRSKIRGFLHLYSGEEAIAVGVMQSLTTEDPVLATYREHGQALARGIDPGAIMAEMYGKQQGCSGGRGGSMHLFDIKKKFYGGNAIVAGHLPLSVGMALALKKQKSVHLACCFFGEGAMAEGEFHESMNLAGLWQVPLLLVCENNLYAMGTAIRFSHATEGLEKKGEIYGIRALAVDGMDVLAVENASKVATDYIRKTGKPFFLVCQTYRFRAHSMFDAELYREKSEVEEWKKRDPIVKLSNLLISTGKITSTDLIELESKTESEINLAVEFAESGTFEPIDQITKFVYSQ